MSRVWHKGPPPHVGWWNASYFDCRTVWRWWNGKNWSLFAGEDDTVYFAAKMAMVPIADSHSIMWTNYWPKNARVPRTKL